MTIRELELTMQSGLESLRGLQVSDEVEQARALLLPEGLSPVVVLLPEDTVAGRAGAASEGWNPLTGRILISFKPQTQANALAEVADETQGSPSPNTQSRFRPVPIRGEPGSATLLADRGSY